MSCVAYEDSTTEDKTRQRWPLVETPIEDILCLAVCCQFSVSVWRKEADLMI